MQVRNAVYPSRAAMLAMMQSLEMREIGTHRGLAGQLNIETADAAGLWLGQESI